MTIIIGRMIWVFKHGKLKASDKTNMTGIRAYKMFLKRCREEGIDMEKYALSKEEGLKVKKTIESPLIFNTYKAKTFYHVNHLDFNSAWPSSVIAKYPELEPVYAKLNKDAKNVFNGYAQSEYSNYKFALIAQAGINGCNAIIRDYIWNRLPQAGFEVLGVNTDGIWYRDKTGQGRVYHDENEGEGFGKWKTDYVDCEWYATSDGQYFFITPDGKFHARARGDYLYSYAKPYEDWDSEEDYFKAIKTRCAVLYDHTTKHLYIRRF